MRILIPILLVLAMVSFIACGPATDDGGTNGDNPDGHPTATVTPTETPKDDRDPTKEPEPTETPKPSGDQDKHPEPTPTRDPDDPPGATAIPTPTYAPPPPQTPKPPYRPNPDPIHPDGLAGCKSWNIFASPWDDSQYSSWCIEALGQDVADNCRSAGGTENQLACGRDRMADVVDATHRGAAVCQAVTDDDDRRTCFGDNLRKFGANMEEIWQFWPPVQQKVDSDPGVKERKIAVGDCMVDKGYERPDATAPIPWHIREPLDTKSGRMPLTAEQMSARIERDNAMDDCAITVGLYDAQKELWINEINRLLREDPTKAQAMKEHGLIDTMEMDGPPVFLHRRTRR